LGYPPLRVDLLTEIDGVSFEECFKNRREVVVENFKVNFISYNDLLKNKKEAGRPCDIDDIDNLQE
jgi:predicted nucleotidyltransferase